MPRVIVISDPGTARNSAVTLNERLSPADLGSGHYSAQLIERVGWAVHDADDAEREAARQAE